MKQRKIVLYIAQSLDGYIARTNNDLSWLDEVESEGDAGFSDFYKTTSTMIMGSGTYKHLMTLVDEFPHKDRECFVFSRTNEQAPEYLTYVNQDVTSFVNNLDQNEGKDIWLVGGGDLVAQFLNAGLIDEFIISIAPIILGDGIPLYPTITKETKLKLIEQKTYGQFVQIKYKNIS